MHSNIYSVQFMRFFRISCINWWRWRFPNLRTAVIGENRNSISVLSTIQSFEINPFSSKSWTGHTFPPHYITELIANLAISGNWLLFCWGASKGSSCMLHIDWVYRAGEQALWLNRSILCLKLILRLLSSFSQHHHSKNLISTLVRLSLEL